MCKENESANRARQFAERLHSDNQSLHNHKEIMAHACVVLEIALFGTIMSKDDWAVVRNTGWTAWVAISVIWLILHLYMRWELRNRRWSATRGSGIRAFLAQSVTRPERQNLEPYKDEQQLTRWRYRAIDYLIPLFRGGIPREHAVRDYPIALVEAFRNE